MWFQQNKRRRYEVKTKVKTRQPGKRGTFGHYFKAHWQLYMMVAFPVIMLAVFSYAPMYGILLAFKNYRIVDGIWGKSLGRHISEWTILYGFLITIILWRV